MTTYPIPLDNMITYVRSLHPEGDPLDHLAAAVVVSTQLDNQADALLGHFVDQARRSGASWTQIGANMGVSKQAARKRFIPRWDGSDPIPESQLYSRFTLRSRNALVAAARIAERAHADQVDPPHLVAGLLSEPDGLAAKIMNRAGIDAQRVHAAFDLEPALAAAPDDALLGSAALHGIPLTEATRAALRGTMTAALRLGHNYVGTEHLLLGVLIADGSAAAELRSLGLTVERVEAALADALTTIQAQRPTR